MTSENRKSYGEHHITVIAEIPEDGKKKDDRDIIIQMLSDISEDLLNDFTRTYKNKTSL